MTHFWNSRANSKSWSNSRFRGGIAMPTYDYICRKCKKPVTITLTLREYEEGKTKCPHCGSVSLKQQITSFMTKTSRKG